MSEAIRILIVDDHEVVRRGLALVLRQEPDFQVAGEAQDGEEALKLCGKLQPHVVVLDWKMPQMSGVSAAQFIRRQWPEIRILMLSGAPTDLTVLDALEEGIDGFVHKDISPENLAHAIRVVAGGSPYLGPQITEALISRSRQGLSGNSHGPPRLSPREMEVLQLMATPATYREIGEQLFISEETVRTYVKRILHKLDQPNRTQAVIAALRTELIKFD